MLPRGIIITPTNRIDATTVPPFLDPVLLRKCLLYWDMIDCPDDVIGGSLQILPEKDYKILIEEGILQRTTGHLLFTKGEGTTCLSCFAEKPYEFFSMAQMYALKKHYSSGLTERWSVGQIGRLLRLPDPSITNFIFVDKEWVDAYRPNNVLKKSSNVIYLPKKDIEEKPAIGVELFRALPIPSAEVSISEILKFKHKRYGELLRFRHAMDELYERALNSKDIQSAIEYAIDEIDISLRDIHKAMDESFITRFGSSVKIELSVNDIILAAIAGGFIGQTFGLPHLGAIVGVTLLSSVKISLDSSLMRLKAIPPDCKDFAYLYYADANFGIKK